jgi:hypothetical protein
MKCKKALQNRVFSWKRFSILLLEPRHKSSGGNPQTEAEKGVPKVATIYLTVIECKTCQIVGLGQGKNPGNRRRASIGWSSGGCRARGDLQIVHVCALVGRFTYRALSRQGILDWVSNTWSPLLGYTPETMIQTRGWYCFIFNSPKDSMRILQATWVLKGGSLMLKIWRVGFDPAIEYFQLDTYGSSYQAYRFNFGMKEHLPL